MANAKLITGCLIFVVITLLNYNLTAQNSNENSQINGVIQDSVSGEGISYVTITVQNESGVVKCLASDASGNFELPVNCTGNADVIFHSVGYEMKKVGVTLGESGSKIDLGTIQLSPENEDIDEVTVTAQKPLVRIEIDKIVYNLEADPESKTTSVMEMLRKVPLLSVDGDDNIQLRGSSNFKILVNGKSSTMLSQNYKDVLRSMPAATVRDIEVITDPSSRYEAEGTAGIINIIVNRKRMDGYQVRPSLSTDTYDRYRTGLFAMTKIGKFGLCINFTHGKGKNPGGNNSSFRENLNSTTYRYTETSGTNRGSGPFNYMTGEASFEIDTLNLISMAFTGYFGKWYGVMDKLSTDYDINRNLTRQYERISERDRDASWFSGNIDYQRSFPKPDKTFTVSYKLEDFTRDIDNITTVNGILNFNSYRQNLKSMPTGREHTLQIDFFNPVSKKHQMETGLKYILRQNFGNSARFFYDFGVNDWIKDETYKNDLDYDQHILGIYAGYQLKTEKISVKPGFRIEATINDGVFRSKRDTSFTNKMFNIVPYIAFARNFTKEKTLKASYTQRLQRPGIWYLNPFYDDTDPQNIRYGNPALDAEVRHSFDITYGNYKEKLNLNISLNGAFANNTIQNISTVNEEGVRTHTFENIGHFRRIGINIFGSLKIGEKINMNSGLATEYVIIKSNDSRNLKNDDVRYSGRLNVRYNIWKGGTLSGFAGAWSSWTGLQTSTSTWTAHNISFTQNLFKKKLSVSLTCNSPFQKEQKWIQYFKDPSFTQSDEGYWPTRHFRINMAYTFGQLQDGVKKAKRSIKNEDVKQEESGR